MKKKSNRHGAVLATVAIFLPVAIVLAAFAINVAYMELSRAELRVAADAAARAGGRTLALTGDAAIATSVAKDYAARNNVAGEALQLADSDIVLGQSTRTSIGSRYDFQAGRTPFNAMTVSGRRTSDSLNGAVQLFLPKFLGVDEFEPVQNATATQIELDLAIVLDRSGSMAFAANEPSETGNLPIAAPFGWSYCNTVPPGSRWGDAVVGVNAFLSALTTTPQSEHVALITYSDASTIDVNLSADYAYSVFDGSVTGSVSTAMEDHSASFCGGATNIGGAIRLAEQALGDPDYERPWAAKAIVLLTDGIHNTGTPPRNPAKHAGKKGITVYTITFSDEANQTDMEQVANLGSGLHVHASTGSDLVDAYRKIAESLPTLLTD